MFVRKAQSKSSVMKKILVPVDFSLATDRVLALAAEMAKAFSAELHLVHVREIATLPVFPAATIGYPAIGVPDVGMPGGVSLGAAGLAPIEPPNDQMKNQLVARQEELTRAGVSVVTHEPTGTVVQEILKTADAISPDLIVMGSHGHGSVYNLLVGSVTEGVLKTRKCPVLLVPTPSPAK